MRAGLDANAEDGFAKVAEQIEAVIAEFQAELVFALSVKAAVAFVASGEGRVLYLFAKVHFRTDFERSHKTSPLV